MQALQSRQTILRLSFFLCSILIAALHSSPVYSAAGEGDGTTSSSWMEDGRYLRALSIIKEKRYAEASNLLQTIVKDHPDFANAWSYLGFSLRKSEAFEKSEEAYLTALKLDEGHRGAMAYLGELYLQTNRRFEALAMEKRLASACRYGCPELEELRAALMSANNDRPPNQTFSY